MRLNFLRAVTLSHVFQFLLLVGIGILIWQVALLRNELKSSKPGVSSRPIPVEIQNADAIKVEVDNPSLDVDVTNPSLDVHVTNPDLDVYVTNQNP